LADVAPTILKIMGIQKPEVMTGKELIWKEWYK
jgi:bisphosphoglycerate-independent phosphoglycerate mutase (AlkP superfamily)